MIYKKHKINPDGSINLQEIIEESDDDDRTGKVHGRMIPPNEPVPDYPEIKEDKDFDKYRTQENTNKYEAKLKELEPSKQELKEQKKARKEKKKREEALERLIQKEMKKIEKE